MEKQGCEFIAPEPCDIYLASMGDAAQKKCVELAVMLRDEGFKVEYDIVGRGLKAQMKYADKINAKFSMVLGDNEIESGSAKLKNMKTGEQTEISLGEGFADAFSDIAVADMFNLKSDTL